MKSKVLFTNDKENIEQGIEHLLLNGIWLRFLTQKQKKSALIYSLDKTLLVEFADVFGLKRFRDGHTVQNKDRIVHPFCIEVWGRKLDAIECWKRELSSDPQGSAGIPQS